jgi:hypothetical protein
MTEEWQRVPVGPESERWTTRPGQRVVLAIVHNVTSLTRLLDMISVLDDDSRLQVVFTWTRSSPFTHDVEQFMASIGAIVIPWDQASTLDADLAIAASYGGGLEEIKAPLIIASHGMGYNKYLNRESGIGNRESGIGNRESDGGWRMADGGWPMADGENSALSFRATRGICSSQFADS